MKKLNSKQAKTIGAVLAVVVFFVSGMVVMVSYQRFVDRAEARGIVEYKELHCKEFKDATTASTWLECDVVKGQ